MNRNPEGYIFPRNERQMIPTIMCFLTLLLVILGIVTFAFSLVSYQIFILYVTVSMIIFAYFTINHMRYKKYRAAKYCIAGTSISVRYGESTKKIDINDDYNISVLQLYRSSGKAYSYDPYIVLWQESLPNNAVHPFELMERNYVILPYSDNVIHEAERFIDYSEIPAYPKFLHHNGVTKSNELLMF